MRRCHLFNTNFGILFREWQNHFHDISFVLSLQNTDILALKPYGAMYLLWTSTKLNLWDRKAKETEKICLCLQSRQRVEFRLQSVLLESMFLQSSLIHIPKLISSVFCVGLNISQYPRFTHGEHHRVHVAQTRPRQPGMK